MRKKHECLGNIHTQEILRSMERFSGRRLSLCVMSILAVVVLVLTAFGQVVAKSYDIDSIEDEQSAVIEETSLTSIDSGGGDSASHKGGLERSSGDEKLHQPPDGRRTVATVRDSPTLTETSNYYEFETRYGIYHFDKEFPCSMILMNLAGEVLVQESRFLVVSNVALREENAMVVELSHSLISARTNIVSNSGNLEGTLTVTTEFGKDEPPKITADFERAPHSRLNSFSIEWHLTTDNAFLSSQDASIGEFSKTSGMKFIPLKTRWVKLSPSGGGNSTQRNVIVDWRDFPGGSLYAGKTESSGEFHVQVKFPVNRANIDPSVVVENVEYYSTMGPTKRTTFYAAGYYWVFYRDGYRIYYKNSHDGASWSEAFDAGTWTDVVTFDISHVGLNVAICYIRPDKEDRFMFRRGHIADSGVRGGIKWDYEDGTWVGEPPLFVRVTNSCSITTSTDGTYYVAITGEYLGEQGREYKVRVFMSNDGGSIFYEEKKYSKDHNSNPYDTIPYTVVANMTNSKVAVLWGETDDSGLYWAIRESDGWSDQNYCDKVKMPVESMPNVKWDVFSAIATYDDNLHVAYIEYDAVGNYYRPAHATLQGGTCWCENVRDFTSDSILFPTISLDADGFLHVFFREKISETAYKIYYSREIPNPGDKTGALSWFAPSTPFGTSFNPQETLTAPKYFTSKSYIVWTEYSSPQYDIMFGSFPVLTELSSFPRQPWRAEGLSPYQEYFASYGQYVFPWNGQLTIYHTDLALRGRGLDLSISRIFMPKRVFMEDGVEDTSPYVLAFGWKLDFPWVGERYLHLWRGQQYLIIWNDDVFENHKGEHFKLLRHTSPTLSYTLYTKDGLTYSFDEEGKVVSIMDLTGLNGIVFEYDSHVPARLIKITDTIGRSVDFSYSSRLDYITYEGRTVQYGYEFISGGWRLTTVSDTLSRTTTYQYWGIEPRLIWMIIYPSVGFSEYEYESDKLGTDSMVYRVIKEKICDVGTSKMENRFQYEDVDGKVLFTRVSHYDRDTLKAYSEYSFDPVLGGMRIAKFDKSRKIMQSTKVWYGTNGMPRQADAYLGESRKLNYSTHYSFDDWGNMIYQRGPLGHERFSTYLNTNKKNGWFKGAFMSYFESDGQKTGDYSVFYDDFLDWDLSDWEIDDTYGTVDLDSNVFLRNSPSLRVSSDGEQAALATHSILDPAIFLEALVQMETITNHYIAVRSGGNHYSKLKFDKFGNFAYYDADAGWVNYMSYYPKVWYWVGIRVYVDIARYDLWLNGNKIASDVRMMTAGPSDTDYIQFQCCNGLAGTMWIDKVNVYDGESLKVSGLSAQERITLLDQDGQTVVDERFTGGGIWEWNWIPTSMHAVKVMVYSKDGELSYLSPFKILCPSHFVYDPSSKSLHLELTEPGFLKTRNNEGPYVEDSLPSGAQWDEYNDIPWEDAWTDEPLPVSGTLSHRSSIFGSLHEHWFFDASEKMTPSSNDYHVQYVYLPKEIVPREVMIGYYVSGNVPNYAYWGEDKITNRPYRSWMGDIPSSTSRWLMFIMKSDDMGTVDQNVDGIRYTLYGGTALWDYSALGDSGTGQIVVKSGLSYGKVVKLFDPDDKPIAQATFSASDATLDLYGEGINVFPIKGYFRIEHPDGSLEYESPVFDSLWGGDKFTYSIPTNLYPNEVSSDVHSLLAGIYEWQDGPDAQDPVLMETCYKYGNSGGENGRVTEIKTLHADAGIWIYESFQYDTWGNLEKYWDANNHEISFSYNGQDFANAFLWKQTETVDGVVVETIYDYYVHPPGPRTGDLKSITNPRGFMTSFNYDEMGRVKEIHYPDLSYVEYEYHDSSNQIIIYNENRHRTRQTFDGLGRLAKVERLDGAGQTYSEERYEYNWLDEVTMYGFLVGSNWHGWHMDYDALGRITKVTDPYSKYKVVEYDDLSNFVTLVDEEGHKKLWAYDYGGRLSSVREYYSNPSDYYETSYEYDEVDNLRKVIFNVEERGSPIQERIEYAYDDLNRLVQIYYPDDSPPASESWGYDIIGNVISHTDRKGNTIEFDYDEASQLKKIWYPEVGHYQEYSYDENGNVESITRYEQSDYFSLSYGYDERDRVELCYFQNTGGSVGFAGFIYFNYDDAGNLIKLVYPDGYELTYDYDYFDRPNGVNGGTIAQLTYAEDDAIEKVIYGNGVTTHYSYDWARRLSRIHVYYDGPPSLEYLDLNYYYYDNGDIKWVISFDEQGYYDQEYYEYDNLGRLTRYWRDSPPKDINYGYDSMGNRLYKGDDDIGQYYYAYGAYNRIDNINEQIFFDYDENGNTIVKDELSAGGSLWTYGYYYDNNLETVTRDGNTIAEYFYDGLGRRVVSKEGYPDASTRIYVYVGDSVVYEWDPETRTGLKYVYAHGILLARIHEDSSVEYYFQDAAGNTRLVVDDAREILFSTNYKPFGLEFAKVGSEIYKYSGEHYDSETGLYYFGARYYDPDLGRFITEDPLEGFGQDPQTLNRYIHGLNNPLRYRDPTGELIVTVIVIVVLIVVGICLGVASVTNPEVRPYLDAIMMVAGFVPVYGDILAGAYFLTQDALLCAQGECDPVSIGIDLFGLLPLAGDIGKLAKGARYVDLLPFAGRLAGKTDDIAKTSTNVRKWRGPLGGFHHQNAVERIAGNIQERGLEAVREYRFAGAGGKKIGRFADVVAIDPRTKKIVEIYQVGDVTKRGRPIAREARAIADIEGHKKARGLRVIFVPKYMS